MLKKAPYQQGVPIEEPDYSGIDEYTEKINFENGHTSFFPVGGDGSGFEYDTMPENTIGPRETMESTYDIADFGIEHNVLKMSPWNAWIEKYQKGLIVLLKFPI